VLWSIDSEFYRDDDHISQKYSHVAADVAKALPRVVRKPPVVVEVTPKENFAPEVNVCSSLSTSSLLFRSFALHDCGFKIFVFVFV